MPLINRYSDTLKGAITFTGNTAGLSKLADANLAGTVASIGAFSSLNVGLIVGDFPAGTTLNIAENGSNAQLVLPVGSSVVYAELVWGGNYYGENGNDGSIVDISGLINNSVLFTTPAASTLVPPDPATAQEVSSSQTFPPAPFPFAFGWYERSQDVTALVQAGGPGTYSVQQIPGLTAPIDAQTSGTNHAGWTLAVVYTNPALPYRNIDIYVGAQLVDRVNNPSVDVPISGFVTPPSGPVTARLLVSAQEGDATAGGDQLFFGPDAGSVVAMSGPNNPIDNFFSSQINNDSGNLDTTGTFGTRNQDAFTRTNIPAGRQGWDITNIDASAEVFNTQTEAIIRFTTEPSAGNVGESYMPNMVALQIDAYAADVSITKSSSPNPVIAGEKLTYTLVVNNAGPYEATTTIVTDSLPVQLSNTEYSLNGGTTWLPWAGSLNLGTVAINTPITILLRGDVSSNAMGTLTNTASVTSDALDPDPSNNTATATTQVAESADVAIVKTALTNPAIAGQLFVYNIDVTNNGPSDAQGVVLNDTPPAILESPQYSLDSGATWNTWLGSLPIGTVITGNTVNVQLRGTITASSTGTMTNTATVIATTSDPDPTNNTSTVTVPLTTSADVSIVKTNVSGPVTAGGPIRYSLVVANLGPSDALGVVVNDTIPPTIQTPEYSLDGGTTWLLWGGSLPIGTLVAGGAPTTILIRGTVSASATGNLVNTATVTSTTPDPNPANNTSTVTNPVGTSADVSIVKTNVSGPVVAGGPIRYSLVVANLGPSNAQGVVVNDAVLPTIQNPEYSLDGGATWLAWVGSVPLGTLIADDIPITVLIRGIVSASAIGTLTNTAIVTSTTPDPNPTNNTSTVTEPVGTLADVSIVKTNVSGPVVAGSTVRYSLVVANIGPSDALSVVVSDEIPAVIQTPEYSLNGGTTWFAWTGSVELGTLATGATPITILIRGIVSAAATGELTNTATVTSTTPDPNPTNNTSTVTNPIAALADVSIVKTNVSGLVVAGSQVRYSLVVANLGPSDALGVVASDAVPTVIQNPEYSLDGGMIWLAWSGSVELGTLVAGGTPITVLVRGTVRPSATGTLINTVTVTSTTPDPNPSNNTSTVTDPVNTLADLVITKEGAPDPVTAGSLITYTIIVTNNGPSDAQDTSLTDQVVNAIQNPQYSLDEGMTWFNWNGSLSLGTITVGNPVTVRIRGTVSSTTTGNLRNTASVISQTPDPNPNNNTVTIRTLVNNVAIVKSSPVTGVEVGDIIPYILTITNRGEAIAEAIMVTDILVPELTYENNLKLNGTPINGIITQGVGIGNLLPGQSAILTFDARVNAVPTNKIINNQGTATYQYRANPTAPLNPGTITSNIHQVRIYTPSLQVTKEADSPSAVVGEPFTYTINVTNTGDIAIDHVVLTDALPVSFQIQNITVDNVVVNGHIGTGIDIGTLDIGQTKVVKVTIIINDTVNISTFRNVAHATGEATVDPAFPPRLVTATGTDSIGVAIYNPKLALVKSADKAYAVVGDLVTYTVKATNVGNVDLSNIQLDSVTISDLLSGELEFVEGSVTLDGLSLPNTSILAGVNIGSILVNQTKTLTFKVKVLSAVVTPIENTALGEFSYQVPDKPIKIKTVQSNPYNLNVSKASLTLVKTADKEEVSLGEIITYTVKINNTGNLIAYNVLFTDTLPVGVELVPGSFKIDTQVVNGVDLAKGITLPAIAPGVSVILTYQVKVVGSNCSGVLINQAKVVFNYRLPDGTGGTITETGESSAVTVKLNLTTFKQMSLESYLMIPEAKPDIETINGVTGTIDIASTHVITTPESISTEGQQLTGYKLIIKGILNIVVEYTALELTQSVHSAHYTVPFSIFIVLPPTYVMGSKLEVTGLVEDLYYKEIDIRTFFTNTTALINVKILSC